MVWAVALALVACASPGVTWNDLDEGELGVWWASARSPVLDGGDPLSLFVNKDSEEWCRTQLHAFGRSVPKRAKPGKIDLMRLAPTLSVCDEKAVSLLYTATETRNGVESKRILTLTYGLCEKGPKRLALTDVLKPDVQPPVVFDQVVGDEVDQALREEVRNEAWADQFVITPTSLAWVIRNKVVKVPIEDLEKYVDKSGPLSSFWPMPVRPVTVRGTATWKPEEAIPFAARLLVSLLKDKNDPLDSALGVSSFTVTYPPTTFDAVFQLNSSNEDDRYYLDVRVMSGTKTLYRNRSVVRVPVEGWQTRHEIKLERERN